jgi:transcriptional regulator with XRE-family HTH domain
MNEEKEKRAGLKPSGRRYTSVTDLLKGEDVSREVVDKFNDLASETKITRRLAEMRLLAGLSQEQMAERLGCTQSAVSKLESGRDEDLTIAVIRDYAKETGDRVGLLFGKPLNHVEAIKAHAFGIRERLTKLASLAHEDEDLEKEIQAFFGEAFFNILSILAKCQERMPNSGDVEVRVQLISQPDERRLQNKRKRVRRDIVSV